MKIAFARVALPLAAVAAVVAVGAACSSGVSGNGTAGHATSGPQAASSTTAGAAAAADSASTTAPTGTASTTPATADWVSHTNFGALPHPDMNCTPAGLGGKVEVTKVVAADLTGDGRPEAVVRMDCDHSASEWPDTVDVYSAGSSTPTMIGSLLTQHDSSYAPTITTAGHTVTLGLQTWSTYAAGCCPDLHYTRTFTWTGTAFAAGPRLDQLRPCAETAFAVSAGDQQAATGHGSIVLRLRNRLSQRCTVQGYPGVDAMSAGGTVLAHASRTVSGFAGGAHTIAALTVAPGQTVSALVEWLNVDPATSGACATSSSIEVTPANTTGTVPLPVHVAVCGLQVHPTVAGATGNG